jgi:hypothetical protein
VSNPDAELRKPEIGTQFVSFNFTNALICADASSAQLNRIAAPMRLPKSGTSTSRLRIDPIGDSRHFAACP